MRCSRSHSLSTTPHHVPFVCVCALTYKYFYYTALARSPMISYSKCIWYGKRMHETAHVSHTNYLILWIYGENVQNNIYSLWKWMWCTLLNLSHFNMPYHAIRCYTEFLRISLNLLSVPLLIFPFVCISQTSTISLCTSNRLILLKHHHSLGLCVLASISSPFEYYKFLKRYNRWSLPILTIANDSK